VSEGLVQLGLSNLLISGAIGLLAFGVHRRGRYPALAHLLWVLALVKVVTPPVLSMPLAVLPAAAPADGSASFVAPATRLGEAPGAAAALPTTGAGVTWAWLGEGLATYGPVVLVAIWLLGSGIVALASARRIRRFSRLLAATSTPAPAAVQRAASTVAYELGVRPAPLVAVSAAELAPMTWWAGRRVRIVLPRAFVAEAGADQLRWVLAHELAHVRRRDHLVRWLEWAASVAGWWNPVVWWARRSLRRDEEDACDALVLEHVSGGRRSYARALLAVTELLSRPPVGTPAFATGIDAAHSLEHRFQRIVRPGRTRSAPRALAAGTIGTAVLLLLAGFHAVGVPTTAGDAPFLAAEATEPAVPGMAAGTSPLAPSAVAAGDLAYGEVSAVLPTGIRTDREGLRVGTSTADVILGAEDGDTIRGLAGADRLRGGRGADVIGGGAGADEIRGGGGADALSGGRGDDVIGGGAGDDRIIGGPGDDDLRGGAGRDAIMAGAGDDVVRVWADGTADAVDCGGGFDRAFIDPTDTAERCEVVVVRDAA
jgi:beta-lactamase regulating signal transducer with metallopeptidase domain